IAAEVLCQSPLRLQYARVVEARDPVLTDRNLHGFDVFQKLALARETSNAYIETRTVEAAGHINELPFCATDREHCQKLEDFDRHDVLLILMQQLMQQL